MKSLEMAPHVEPPSRFLANLTLKPTSLDCVLAGVLLALVTADLVIARAVHLSGPERLLYFWPWIRFGLMYLLVIYCVARPLPRMVDAARFIMWATIFLDPVSMLYQIAGRTRFGLVDLQLATIDHRVHFSTDSITHAVGRLPLVAAAFLAVYCLFGPMTVAALTIPALCGRSVASRRFLVSMLMALFLGAAISVFLPAAGPWTTEHVQPSRQQAGVSAYLQRLKTYPDAVVEKDNEGIVSFPSMHVVLALLAAQALATVRKLRIPAWGIGALICISTLTTGWHYGIDILGGIAVAIVSSALAKLLCGFLESVDLRPGFGLTCST